jgi:hypothetical protein
MIASWLHWTTCMRWSATGGGGGMRTLGAAPEVGRLPSWVYHAEVRQSQLDR